MCHHRGRLRLQWCDGGQVLFHKATAEVVRLPMEGGRWALRYDGDGDAYVRRGEERLWVDQLFKMTLCHDGPADGAEGVLFVVGPPEHGGDIATWRLDTWLRTIAHRLAYELPLQPTGVVRLEVSLVRPAQHQCRCMWSLLPVFVGLRLRAQKGRAGRWASHGWAAWKKFVTSVLGLSEVHMPALGVGGERCDVNRQLSTFALLALLARWCSEDRNGHLRDIRDRAAANQCFEAFIALSFHDNTEQVFSLFLDVAPKCGLPGLPAGDRLCDVPVVGDRLHLKAVFRRCPDLTALLAGACEGPDRAVRISTALLRLSSTASGSMGCSVFRQLVIFVGRRVEDSLSQVLSFASAPSMAELTTAQAMHRMTKYYLGAREAFANPQTVHMAVDGSTLGKKALLCGLLVKPDNVGIVLPPLVRRAPPSTHLTPPRILCGKKIGARSTGRFGSYYGWFRS